MGRCQIGSLGLCHARRRISGRCAVWLVGLVGAILDRTVSCSSLLDPVAAPCDLDRAMPASCKKPCSSQTLTFIKDRLCKPLLPGAGYTGLPGEKKRRRLARHVRSGLEDFRRVFRRHLLGAVLFRTYFLSDVGSRDFAADIRQATVAQDQIYCFVVTCLDLCGLAREQLGELRRPC